MEDDMNQVLTKIMGGHSAPLWCESRARLLSGFDATPFEVAAAVGLIGRFWRPKDGEMRDVAGTTPGHRAREWWAHLPDQDRREVFDEACEWIDDLARGLSIIQKTKQWNWFARQLLLDRHDLESVLFVMGRAPGAHTLREALRDIDKRAAPLFASWGGSLRDDPVLCALAAESGAWWPGGINS
jgi:hypothetical protein